MRAGAGTLRNDIIDADSFVQCKLWLVSERCARDRRSCLWSVWGADL